MDRELGEAQKVKSEKQILICESYPGLRKTFDLMLGEHYELIFTSDPAEIRTLLLCHSIFLIIWDLDHRVYSLQEGLKAARAETVEILDILQSVRRDYSDLPILLVAGEFAYDFQVAAIQQCGGVRFLTKPWESSAEVVERIQILLGDKRSSIHQWVLKIPLAERGKT